MNDAVASHHVGFDDLRTINGYPFVRYLDIYHLPIDCLGLHRLHCRCWHFCWDHVICENTHQFLLVFRKRVGDATYERRC